MKPILARSEITDAVYIVTKYKIFKDGLVRTIEKYDVTDQFDAMTEPLRAENAKLRELAKNLYECNGSCERCVELMGRCEYKEQLRELGIEAD